MAATCAHCGSADVQAELHVYRCLNCEGYTTMDGQPADTSEPLERNPVVESPEEMSPQVIDPIPVEESVPEEVADGESETEPESEAG